MARLKFFIGICLSLTLFGIVFVVLYSLIFVTQPLNAISPIDQKFFELIVPIATFLTGTLSGIMLSGGDKDAQKQALEAANKGWDKTPSPSAPPSPSKPEPAPVTNSFGSVPHGGKPPVENQPPVAVNTSFGSVPLGGNTASVFAAPAPVETPVVDFQPQVVTGFGGKPMPVQPPHPEL